MTDPDPETAPAPAFKATLVPKRIRRVRKGRVSAMRAPDASKLSFPIQLVITIVLTFCSALGAVWSTQRSNDKGIADLQSDVRNILTQMENERRIMEVNTRLQEAASAGIKRDMEAISKKQELLQLQYAQMNESIIRLSTQTAARR